MQSQTGFVQLFDHWKFGVPGVWHRAMLTVALLSSTTLDHTALHPFEHIGALQRLPANCVPVQLHTPLTRVCTPPFAHAVLWLPFDAGGSAGSGCSVHPPPALHAQENSAELNATSRQSRAGTGAPPAVALSSPGMFVTGVCEVGDGCAGS